MFLVMDNATNNVLAEFASFIEADQWRSQIVGANAPLAPYIEVVNLDAALAEHDAAVDHVEHVQPA